MTAVGDRPAITKEIQGPITEGSDMALAQVGWLAHDGQIIGLHDHSPLGIEKVLPLFIRVGWFETVEETGELRINETGKVE